MIIGAFSMSDKSKAKNAVCVGIDTYHSRFDFYRMENGDRGTIVHKEVPYRMRLYSSEFMEELKQAAGDYANEYPAVKEASITLVLPDNAVSMDTINLPSMNRRRSEDAVEATIRGLYKNYGELRINRFLAAQNKHTTTYSLTVAQDRLLKAFTAALTEGGMAPTCITFAAGALANAVTQLSPKVKNASYIVMDIKHHITRIAFVAKGRTTGYYSLPFGYSILRKSRVAAEEMLFDHSLGELAVLNARERARAKQLTIMREENLPEDANAEEQLDAQFGNEEDTTIDPTAGGVAVTIKSLPKKQPRKLPQFMQRPIPKTDEEFGYENFRLFMKWALNLLQSNEKLAAQGKPEAVYVNMPPELNYLFEKVNEEAEENGIEFRSLDIRGDRDDVTDLLELYGGLYAPSMNRSNNF